MKKAIRFFCPHCTARIKAPVQLAGRNRCCPGCSHAFTVPRLAPDDSGPVLVPLEANNRFPVGGMFRQSA